MQSCPQARRRGNALFFMIQQKIHETNVTEKILQYIGGVFL